MATLRCVEDRDAKGNTMRVNPTIVYKQDRQIREVIGRHDYRMLPNPDFHPPITAQAQNGKIVFFIGVPDSSATRASAREISQLEVEKLAPYIIEELRKRPMKVREARPTVYEVKLATVGDVETTSIAELPNDGVSVTLTPVEPDLNVAVRAGKAAAHAEAAAG